MTTHLREPLTADDPHHGRTFWEQIRVQCRQRAGARVRFLSGMPAIRRKLTEMDNIPLGEQLTMCPLFSLRPAQSVPDGAVVRTLVSPTVATGQTLQHLRNLQQVGVRVRVAPGADQRIVIVNRNVALVDITTSEQFAQPEAVVLTDPELVRQAVRYYEQVWIDSRPLPGSPAHGLSQFTARQRRVLDLLSDGLTDDQISRELTISSRSVRTEVAAIRKVLGAESRFQAGVRYAELLAAN